MKTTTASIALCVLLLAGCTPTTTNSDEPADSTGGEIAADEDNCLVGVWDLDLANYREQAQAFLTSMEVPVQDLVMDGSQVLSIGPSGIIQLDTNVTTSGTIVVAGFTGPVSAHTETVENGDWELGDDGTLTISNWTSVSDASTATEGADDVPVGAVDFSEIPTIATICNGDSLFLQGPDAPLGSYWNRR